MDVNIKFFGPKKIKQNIAPAYKAKRVWNEGIELTKIRNSDRWLKDAVRR